jgi:hypothetical protein
MKLKSSLKKEYRIESKERPWGKFLRPFLGFSQTLFAFLVILYSSFLILPLPASAATLTKPPTNLGLVGYWSFNEGTSTVVTDFSGNGNNGTTTNMANPATATSGWNNGKRGNALNFDGVNDYASIPHSNSLEITGDITIAGWVKFISTGSNSKYCFEKGGSFNNSTPWVITCNNNAGNIGFNHNNSTAGNGASITSPNNSVPIGVWTHFAAVRDTNALTQSIYINGVLVTGPTAYTIPPTANGKVVLISAEDGPANYSKDNFDELRIYNRTLSASEITALYKSGAVVHKTASDLGLVGYWSLNEGTSTTATDFSGNGNNGTLQTFANPPTATSGWTNGKFGKALVFDGVSDYVVGGKLINTSVVTVSAWVKLSSYPSLANGFVAGFLNGIDGTSYDKDIYIDTNGKARFYVYSDPSQNHTSLPSSPVPLNQWTLLTGVYDGTNAYMYMNGIQIGSVASGATSIGYTVPDLFINGKNDLGAVPLRYLSGSIDEVRIYNRALSADEVATLYQGSKTRFINSSQNTRITNGLVGFWSFNGADVDWAKGIVYDRSGNNNNGAITNMSTTTSVIDGKVGQAFKFIGGPAIDMGDITSLDGLGAITCSFWMYYDTAKNPAGYHSFIMKDNSVTCAQSEGTGSWYFPLFTPSLTFHQVDLSLIPKDRWVHIVHRWQNDVNGGTPELFVDGAFVSNFSLSSTGTIANSTSAFGIGRHPESSVEPFYGMLDEIRIYNRRLSNAEIKQLYLMGK